MDNDQLIGAGQQFIGGAKQRIGKLLGQTKMEANGKAEQAAGKPRHKAGSVNDSLKE